MLELSPTTQGNRKSSAETFNVTYIHGREAHITPSAWGIRQNIVRYYQLLVRLPQEEDELNIRRLNIVLYVGCDVY